MENKETAISRCLGMCEKLFNALHLNAIFRPLPRIGYGRQEPVAAAATVLAPAPALASSPPVPSFVTKDPNPLSKPSGREHPGGAVGSQPGFSEKKGSEGRPSTVEVESLSAPLKAPSKVEPRPAPVQSKSSAHVEPPAPPLSLTERASNVGKTSVLVPAPALPPPAPAQAPEKVVSKLDEPAVEVERTRTRKNLNEKVDEYINQARSRMRSSSSVGSSASKGARN